MKSLQKLNFLLKLSDFRTPYLALQVVHVFDVLLKAAPLLGLRLDLAL